MKMGTLHWKNVRAKDCALKPIGAWSMVNRGCYASFRDWLREASYSDSSILLYGIGARLVFGLLDKPYWEISLDEDLACVREYLAKEFPSPGTRNTYLKGIAQLEMFLRVRAHRRKPARALNWGHYLQDCSCWLGDAVKAYLAHRQRSWRADDAHRYSVDLVSQLTRPLRGIVTQTNLGSFVDLTPSAWFSYVDARLAAGIQPITLNGELTTLKEFVRFFSEQGESVCARLLEVESLKTESRLPRDLSVEQVQQLWRVINRDAHSRSRGIRRMGLMDRAWFLLMLHSGLRTAEVRRLTLQDLDFIGKKARIEQSKGLKDRIVYLSASVIVALQEYLPVRGTTVGETDYVFFFRHERLSGSYISQRFATYASRCGVHSTPHQLRHTCATLLLNAGAPVLTVQAILGHKHVDTTLGYARLYDGSVAADYYRAMAQVEKRFATQDDTLSSAPSMGELLAHVDALRNGTLSASQRETLHALRAGIAAWAGRQAPVSDWCN